MDWFLYDNGLRYKRVKQDPSWITFHIFLDMVFEVSFCLGDLYNHNYLSKDDYKSLKPCGSKPREDIVKHELRVTIYELPVKRWKLKSTSWNSKVRVQIQNFKFTSYEFKPTSY